MLRVRKSWRLGEKAVRRHEKKVFGRSGGRSLRQRGGRTNQAVEQEVEQKREEKSARGLVTRVDIDVPLQNMQRLTEMFENMGKCGQK